MELSTFHVKLLGRNPTGEQLRLYTDPSEPHGYSESGEDLERLTATFIKGLALAYNPTEGHNNVLFAVPKRLDSWAVQAINTVLGQIKEYRAYSYRDLKAKKNEQALKNLSKAGTMIVALVAKLEMGSRVYSLTSAPPLWVAYGFTKEDEAPEWLKRGLLV